MFTVCDGWINTWMIHESEKTEPETFNSIEDAKAAINEFIREINEEIEYGERGEEDGYSEEDFRIRECITKHNVS